MLQGSVTGLGPGLVFVNNGLLSVIYSDFFRFCPEVALGIVRLKAGARRRSPRRRSDVVAVAPPPIREAALRSSLASSFTPVADA